MQSLVFAAEAEVRWLDHCEARLRRAATEAARPVPEQSDPDRTQPFVPGPAATSAASAPERSTR